MFGVADTLQCLEMGAVETLVVWEDLQVYRYTLMNSTSGESHLLSVHSWMLPRMMWCSERCKPTNAAAVRSHAEWATAAQDGLRWREHMLNCVRLIVMPCLASDAYFENTGACIAHCCTVATTIVVYC